MALNSELSIKKQKTCLTPSTNSTLDHDDAPVKHVLLYHQFTIIPHHDACTPRSETVLNEIHHRRQRDSNPLVSCVSVVWSSADGSVCDVLSRYDVSMVVWHIDQTNVIFSKQCVHRRGTWKVHFTRDWMRTMK